MEKERKGNDEMKKRPRVVVVSKGVEERERVVRCGRCSPKGRWDVPGRGRGGM